MSWKYSKHHKDYAEGHIFLGHDVPEGKGVSILLTGTASMSQDELDELGEEIVKAVNEKRTARCEHGMFFSGAGACPMCGGGAR